MFEYAALQRRLPCTIEIDEGETRPVDYPGPLRGWSAASQTSEARHAQILSGPAARHAYDPCRADQCRPAYFHQNGVAGGRKNKAPLAMDQRGLFSRGQ